MNGVSTINERAAQVRLEFDRGFAAPIQFDDAPTIDLLTIRAGEQTCGIRLSEVSGLHAGRRVTRIPGTHAALRGIAGFRGTILPVYDLSVLLGFAATPGTPRWLVTVKAAAVALSCDGFEGQRRVSTDAVMPQAPGSAMHRYAREFVRAPSMTGPLLHIPSVIATLVAANAEAIPQQEP